MNPNSKMRFSIKLKLLIMIVVIVGVSAIILTFVNFKWFSVRLTESVNNQLNAISEDVANQIQSINTNELTKLTVLSQVDFLRDPDNSLEEKQALLTSVLNQFKGNYENLAFYDKEGNAITADGRLLNFKDRDYFKIAFAGNNYIADPGFSTVTNSVLQYYSVPVYDFNGKAIGVLVSVLKGNALLETIEKIDIGAGMHPSVINRVTEATIANANPNTDEGDYEEDYVPDYTQGIGLVMTHLFAGETAVESFEDPSLGIKMITAYRPVEGTDWSVFAVTAYDFYFSVLTVMKTASIICMVAVIILSVLISYFLLKLMLKPLNSVKESITEISSGSADLTKRIEMKTNDEVGDVVHGFNQFTENLQSIMKDLKNSKDNLTSAGQTLHARTQDTSASIIQIIANIESVHNQITSQGASVHETAGAVNEIASNIESLEKMIENQSAGVSQASTAIEEMMSNIESVNNSVDKMAASFEDLIDSAENGSRIQSEVNEKIENIRTQSAALQEANSAIASIASQTNLLAMNAAIEAAHAGDAGKGFSVVADEIRKLSETSSSQSRTIGDQLSEIQSSIDSVVDASKQSNAAFGEVSQKIRTTDEIVQQIRSAMVEQSQGSQQINEALNAMNDSTAEVHTASREMAEGNKAILEEVQKLQDATINMQSSMDEMSNGARKINETGTALNDIANSMDESIKGIGTQVDKFNV